MVKSRQSEANNSGCAHDSADFTLDFETEKLPLDCATAALTSYTVTLTSGLTTEPGADVKNQCMILIV